MNIEESTLWMGNIEPWMDESFIEYLFIKFGFTPKNVKLIKSIKLNDFKDFCIVKFNNLKEANLVLFTLNGKKMPRTNSYFKLNIMKNNIKNFKNVYVGNLSPQISDEELFNYFKSKYPSVYYASIIFDNGISRGYGFVHFSKEDEYQDCLKEMNGSFFHNKKITVKEKTHVDIKNYRNKNQKLKREKNLSPFSDESTFSSQKDQELFSSKSNNSQTNTFVENIELIEKDEASILNSKIQESINKLYNHEKLNKQIGEISSIILYYKSNYD